MGFRQVVTSQNFGVTAGVLGGALGLYFIARKTLFSTNFLPSKGKVVIITGCDTPQGFGCAAARRLLKLGYVVFAGCLDAKIACETVYADLKDKDPCFHAIQLDVTNQAQVKKAVEEVDKWLKANPGFYLFGIVNNAGIGILSPMEWLQMETFAKVFDVNCFGAVRVTKGFLPFIRRAGAGGRVVFMASIVGELPTPCSMPYCASKAAAITVAECLSIETSQFGIKVSAICPDFYRTNMITNSEKNIADFEKEVAASNHETIEAYGGEPRINGMKQTLVVLPSFAKADFSPVIDCIVDAIASPKPKKRYYPISFFNKFSKFLFYYAPSLLDIMTARLLNA